MNGKIHSNHLGNSIVLVPLCQELGQIPNIFLYCTLALKYSKWVSREHNKEGTGQSYWGQWIRESLRQEALATS